MIAVDGTAVVTYVKIGINLVPGRDNVVWLGIMWDRVVNILAMRIVVATYFSRSIDGTI